MGADEPDLAELRRQGRADPLPPRRTGRRRPRASRRRSRRSRRRAARSRCTTTPARTTRSSTTTGPRCTTPDAQRAGLGPHRHLPARAPGLTLPAPTAARPLPHPATGELFDSPVPPGTGWPGDPSPPARRWPTTRTTSAAWPGRRTGLPALEARVGGLPRLPAPGRVARGGRASTKRRVVRRGSRTGAGPIPGWGDRAAWLLVVGLAPAAHGGNRTGRIFTGDRSGDWIFAALHRAGLATQEHSVHAADGQRLTGARMAAPVRCAPPANKPTPAERDTCAPWFDRELDLLEPTLRVVLALGGFAWDACLARLPRAGLDRARAAAARSRTAPPSLPAGRPVTLLGDLPREPAEHLHRQADRGMLDDVLAGARAAGACPHPPVDQRSAGSRESVWRRRGRGRVSGCRPRAGRSARGRRRPPRPRPAARTRRAVRARRTSPGP